MAIGFTNNYFKNEDFTGACDEKRKKKNAFLCIQISKAYTAIWNKKDKKLDLVVAGLIPENKGISAV